MPRPDANFFLHLSISAKSPAGDAYSVMLIKPKGVYISGDDRIQKDEYLPDWKSKYKWLEAAILFT